MERGGSKKTGYLIPACFYPEELDEVVEDFYEEIFRQELQAWQPDEAYWPDTVHFGLFNRWFTDFGRSFLNVLK